MGKSILFLPVIGVTAFFLLLLSYTKFVGPIPFSINSTTTTKSDTFQTSGTGVVEIKPDIALVTLGVQTNGVSVKATQDQLNSAINKVSQAIKSLGVEDKDIKTTNYSIYPSYDYSVGTQKITGYTASTNLTIKVRQIDKVNDVIDASVVSGANQVGGVSFDVDKRTDVENEARKMAVEEAKKKAETAAKIAGFKLGKIVNYSEGSGGEYPVPLSYGLERTAVDKAAAPPTQVQTGSNEIRVNVILSYEIY